jgi:outer membrane protein assembly factor BamD (BamD/ComL family)
MGAWAKVFARGVDGRRGSALGLLALFALGAAVAAGCGWGGTEHSVRFNYRHGDRQFSRLPPLPFDARERTRPDYRTENEPQAEEEKGEEPDAIWESADAAGREGDFARLRERLGQYLEAGGANDERYSSTATDWLSRRRSARDQLDALDSLGRGASARAVSAYLAARRAYDGWLLAREVASKKLNAETDASDDESKQDARYKESAATAAEIDAALEAALDAVPRDPEVDDNVLYLRAAVYGEGGEVVRAAVAFERFAASHPRSEKREAALLSAGLSWMRTSKVALGTVEHAASEDACPECKDEAWRKAAATFERMLREHPRGRYADDARGWLAFLRVRVGERAEGLAEYYRLLAGEGDAGARAEAVVSLRLVRDGATEDEMARVETLLAREPRAALAYAYHEIYNAALDFRRYVEVPEDENPYHYCKEDEGDSNCWSEFYDWSQQERERRERGAERKTIARVAAFATRLLRGPAAGAYGGALALRVAQADLELGEDAAARELAGRALSAGLAGNERASALWVRGAAEYRLKEFDPARRTFATLLAEFPEGDLVEGARRYIALAAEESGDLDAALEQYLALEYTTDVAYFVDVLMTTEQLASFAARHADSPARDMLLYSLGVRLMREHRYEEARAAYARVRTSEEALPKLYAYSDGCERTNPPPECAEPKNPRWQEWKGVKWAWVVSDLKTMAEIEHLEERFRLASGDEAKAEALYQLAGYLYESSQLTFYNPAAWRGERFHAFYYDQQFRAPGEAALMRRYMEEHEPLVRALGVYRQVVDEYPRTRAARDALYTTAVIHERLGCFMLYWWKQYARGLHVGQRIVSYDDVRRAYPDYVLPAGTYGWEPVTRTVNGHAARPEPPKPPSLTNVERARQRIRRAERRVALVWGLYGEVYGGRPRAWTVAGARLAVAGVRWAVVALAACAVLLVFRRTRRARRFFYRRLWRAGARWRAGAVYAPKIFGADHSAYLRSEGPRSAAGQAAAYFFRLALHERGRAVLALNLFTHGLLVLFWAALWTMR